jgi:hypothetical protein
VAAATTLTKRFIISGRLTLRNGFTSFLISNRAPV